MKTEELIQDLAQRGNPVSPLSHPLVRFAGWAAVSVAAVGLGTLLLGVRSDLASAWKSGLFAVQVVLALGVALSSVAMVVGLSVPGRRNPWHLLIQIGFLSAWTFSGFYASAIAEPHGAGLGLNCLRNIVVLSAIPGFVLYVVLRAAAPLNAGMIGFLATLGVSALSCTATRLVCPHDAPAHFLVWHCLPVVGLSAAGALAGRLVFRRSVLGIADR